MLGVQYTAGTVHMLGFFLLRLLDDQTEQRLCLGCTVVFLLRFSRAAGTSSQDVLVPGASLSVFLPHLVSG